MTDPFNTSAIHDDPEHWDGLATRIALHVTKATRRTTAVEFLAHSRTGPVGACVVLAASLVFLMMSGRYTPPSARTDLTAALAPRDDLGRAMLLRDTAPRIESLVFSAPAEAR